MGDKMLTARRTRARDVRRYLALYLDMLDPTIWDGAAQAAVPVTDLQRNSREQNAAHWLAEAQASLSALTELHVRVQEGRT